MSSVKFKAQRTVKTPAPKKSETWGVSKRACFLVKARGKNPSSARTMGSRDWPRMVTSSRQALLTSAPAVMAAPSQGPPTAAATEEKCASPQSPQSPRAASPTRVGTT